jgi:regulator of cell morphogenesis and NO signaling
MSATSPSTIRDIVAADYRTAAVFQAYGLDFCCRGNRTVEEACADLGVPLDDVLRDLAEVTALPPVGCAPRYDTWDLESLIGHIVSKHHAYVRQQLPVVRARAEKVARVHGERHPEMLEVSETFERVAEEMTSHMMKEEKVLFPYISKLVAASGGLTSAPFPPFGTVANPIRMMEAEHESAGGAMADIRRLTGGYRAPQDACGTYAVLLQELEAFEEDLHQHVHLENNILFPKALRLEATL